MIKSIKSRFLVSLVFNFLRGGFSFASGLLIARDLGPEKYGDFIFLLGSFMALRLLLDFGTSQAFFTMICQKPRGRKFLLAYSLWEGIQFFLPLLVIGLVFTDQLRNLIWLGQDKAIIIMAFVAVFLRERAWKTMTQIGESARLTYRVQKYNFYIAIINFLIIACIWAFNSLSIKIIFGLIIIEYLIAIIIAIKNYELDRFKSLRLDWKTMIREYRSFCAPLVLLSTFGFLCEFADRWLLQNFGGAVEQGFYGVGYQFSVFILIATTSFYQIFWKEIAEAHESGNLKRVKLIYKNVSRFLFTLGAFICGFLIPWAGIIVEFTLGEAYVESALVLAIMFLYPVHQSLGHITGALLLATGKMNIIVFLQSALMFLGIPITYFLLAPSSSWLQGLEMGSLGMAFKMVIVGIISINLVIWKIDKHYGWRFDWIYQLVGLGVAISIGFSGNIIASKIAQALSLSLYSEFVIYGLFYSIFVLLFLWFYPEQAGMTSKELRLYFMRPWKICFNK